MPAARRTPTVGILALLIALPAAGQSAPSPPSHSLFRLTFETNTGPARDSATAFLCSAGDFGRASVLTAYHTFVWRVLRSDSTFASERLNELVTRVVLTRPVDSVSSTACPGIPVHGSAVGRRGISRSSNPLKRRRMLRCG
jgi:hypothetical protein